MSCLLLSVHLHDGRYHGRPDWPPSPARLFQALVAAAAEGKVLRGQVDGAFRWLEALDAPVIAAPPMRVGRSFEIYVPNNDRDAVESQKFRSERDYLSALSKIRTGKPIRPILFDAEMPLIYLWSCDDSSESTANAERIRAIAERLYQLGRGVDMAWGSAEILPLSEAEFLLAAHRGPIYRPDAAAGGISLAVPVKGSLESLIERYRGMLVRFQAPYASRSTRADPGRRVSAGQVFIQPGKPRFAQISYNSPPIRLFFDLAGERASWPLERIGELTKRVRDCASDRLKAKLPGEAGKINNTIVGRCNADEADKSARVRITPLPSIGHPQADRAIRRVLVEIPPNCPLRADDLEWAFSCPLDVSDDGEILCELAMAADRGMLAHYGIEHSVPAHLWCTVTPAALPAQAGRRRIDPACRRAEAKGGAERADEERKAASAVIQALRHAGISARPLSIRVQREPFESRGARAEASAPGTRFAKERLWHVEISFPKAMHGPLILGDGRYLGLGLMAPVKNAHRDIVAFSLPADADVAVADRGDLLQAARRALMALSRDAQGNVPLLFSGHEPGGPPASSGRHRHVFLACVDLDGDNRLDHLIVAAPWACDRSAKSTSKERAQFDRVTGSLAVLRAGRLSVIPLRALQPDQRLIGPAQIWESHTAYRPTRHAGRGKDPAVALLRDVANECDRRGLPSREIKLLDLRVGPAEGVVARLRLEFVVAVPGPILLGRDSHQGGGLFMIAG